MPLWKKSGDNAERQRNGADAGQQAQGSAAAAQWGFPTAVERRLYEAKSRGDWDAYLDTLAESDLFIAMRRSVADAQPGRIRYTGYWNPRTRTTCCAVLTRGMLPPPDAETVYQRVDLLGLAGAWPSDQWWLAVNPATPCEAYFPVRRDVWSWYGERAVAQGRDAGGTLRTLWTGPFFGPLARGLACGALLCVHNGSLWNQPAWHGRGYDGEKGRLEDAWGITSREEWRRVVEALVAARLSSPLWNLVLDVRHDLTRHVGGAVAAPAWRAAGERVIHASAEDGAVSPQGRDTYLQRAGELVGRVVRYESRMRADGVLPEDGHVRSVRAWDLGRASKMARWGLGARFCDMNESEDVLVRTGEAAREHYSSWAEFSAGYVLGRCLHFDKEEFGSWYTDMVAAHQVLTTDPSSPWLNLPWNT